MTFPLLRLPTGWLRSLWALVLGGAVVAIATAIEPQDGGGGGEGPGGTQALPALSTIGTADSNDRMIAVTGIDLTGSAVLFVIDTLNPHLAVYQAQGGSQGTQSLKLVAARNITLDLLLDGYNDRSEYSYKDLEASFREQGLLPDDR